LIGAMARRLQRVAGLADGHADRECDGADVLHAVGAGDDGAGGRGPDLLGERSGGREGLAGQEHRELIPAQARGHLLLAGVMLEQDLRGAAARSARAPGAA
jgi:hypothetical protein